MNRILAPALILLLAISAAMFCLNESPQGLYARMLRRPDPGSLSNAPGNFYKGDRTKKTFRHPGAAQMMDPNVFEDPGAEEQHAFPRRTIEVFAGAPVEPYEWEGVSIDLKLKLEPPKSSILTAGVWGFDASQMHPATPASPFRVSLIPDGPPYIAK